MNKPRVIVSSCGTSILTNDSGELRNYITGLANHKESELTAEDKQKLDDHARERQERLKNAESLEQVKRLSAELNGIITYYDDDLNSNNGVPDQHYLVVSDTYLGKKVGETIELWLKSKKFNVQILGPSGFVTNNLDSFRDAMTELVRWCQETLEGYRESGYHIAFNLTGGFKSAQGFLQAIGMFYADESFYIFETGTLLTIPRLPVKLDIDETITKHLNTFRKLGLGIELPSKDCADIPETLLMEIDEKVILSEWGELIWQQSKIYEKELLEPLPGIVYSENFCKGVAKQNLTPRDRATLNERLDQLHHHIFNDGPNLATLDFKNLKGNPKPPSTHECDIWSSDERRLFGHFDNGNFIIDDIARGLH